MNQERLEAACWAAELRRKGTLLSDHAVAEVCEALLELAGVGTITLELHERVLADQRRARQFEVETVREEMVRQGQLIGHMHRVQAEARAEIERLEALRVQGVAMGQAANRRIEELEAELARRVEQSATDYFSITGAMRRIAELEAELNRRKLEGSP